MSDSRLEKFIYAICSMDVSDLPVPLSRIEKLWNCLITGETPDFEPLSRNEKYLMAMLDRYDISNLPAPMSRGEKLLYKIAVGETDLSDVPGYLSRYEELLKYLIENGGISGGDFEYVLYTLKQSLSTLYTTAEKPVKSAILKGNTLVNLVDLSQWGEQEKITLTSDGTSKIIELGTNLPFKPNTNYLTIIPIYENTINNNFTLGGWVYYDNQPTITVADGTGIIKIIKKTRDVFSGNYFYLELWKENTSGQITFGKPMIIEYQDGMENWDIPYFEGMQSVKMPVLTTIGKNLFDKTKTTTDKLIVGTGAIITSTGNAFTDYIPVEAGKTYIRNIAAATIAVYDTDKNFIERTKAATTFSATANGYIRWNFSSYASVLDTMQIEEGSSITTYEPYKSNILTVNEDVTLRGIGDVRDKLDCLTGEVTESIREIVLDGTQYMDADGRGIYIQVDDMKKVEDYRTIITCDKLPVFYHQWDLPNVENGIAGYLDEENKYPGQNWLYIKVNNSIDVGEVRQILTQKPITVQYQLATESIKTVDLTVVDQDNQPTELGTFENVTHVSLVAENLIPEVEMEVATNLLEDTVFNLTNAFNTLYPTAAKPVKSAILKGQTLVNVVSTCWFADSTKYFGIELNNYKNNQSYMLIMFNVPNNIKRIYIGNSDGSIIWTDYTKNFIKNKNCIMLKITCPSNYDGTSILPHFQYVDDEHPSSINNIECMLIEYQEYMENWDIPFFNGMQSVKMPVLTTTGKNLFSLLSFSDINNHNNKLVTFPNTWGRGYKLQLKPNTTYTISRSMATPTLSNNLCVFNGDETVRKSLQKVGYVTVDTKADGIIYLTLANVTETILTTLIQEIEYIQIEESTTATTYEPHKSNILSTPEEVVLRSLPNGVCDTLNLNTGEYVQRIEEHVLDGTTNNASHDWNICWNDYSTNTLTFEGYRPTRKLINTNDSLTTTIPKNFICDKVKVLGFGSMWQNGQAVDRELSITTYTGGQLIFVIEKSKLTTMDVFGFKQWLSQNPVTIQYELETPVVKTVDLTVVNQDNQPTELGTFDNTTHVLLNSEGLIPTAVLTVRTKIPSASSTSLLMDDISTNQQQLETTVDEQSNNVDATMVATTEIFEETL